MKGTNRIVILVAIVFFIMTGDVFGIEGAEVLRGLKSVRVYIADSLEDSGKRSQLQTDVELKLRLAGIKVDSNSFQTLVVSVHIVKMTARSSEVIGNYGAVQIWLVEEVIVARYKNENGFMANARTWQGSESWFHGPPNDFWNRCRENVRDSTDEFINDYLSVNPK